MLNKSISLLLSLAGTLASTIAFGAESYSPDVERSYPTEVYWGDTHVHTSYSTGDAYLIGANEVTPTVAYRFARGERVQLRKRHDRAAWPDGRRTIFERGELPRVRMVRTVRMSGTGT